jgi:RHS repeat-associated protein
VSADRGWLADPQRAWPVKLDPTSYVSSDRDCEVASGSLATTNFCGTPMRIGRGASNTHRALLYFDFSDQGLEGDLVLAARANLWFQSQTGSTSLEVDAHEITQSWNSSTTWDTRDGSNAWTTAGGTFNSQVESRFTVQPSYVGGWVSFGVGRLVQSWITDPADNHGVMLKARNEGATTNVITLLDDTSHSAAKGPVIELLHKERTGMMSDQTFITREISDRSMLGVNVANGNLVVQSTDARIAGTGIDFEAIRTYNSRIPNFFGEIGDQWQLGAGFDVRLNRNWWDESRWLTMGDGRFFRFDRVPGTNDYRTPPGANADLKRNSNGTHTLTFRKSGLKWEFDSFTPAYLDRIVDKNGHEIEWNYTGAGDPQRAIDTRGRRHEWTVANGKIDDLEDSAGRVYDYQQNSGQDLIAYTDPTNATTQYEYHAGTDLMSRLTDARGNRTEFAYWGASPAFKKDYLKTITHVMDPATTADNIVLQFDYEQVGPSTTLCDDEDGDVLKTTVTDPRGKLTKYCSNRKGQVSRGENDDGHKTTSTYTLNGDGEIFTDFAGTGAGNEAATTNTYGTGTEPTNLTQSKAPAGESVSLAYWGTGTDPVRQYRVKEFTDEQGTKTLYDYDNAGNLTDVKDGASPARNKATLTYTDASDAPVPKGLLETATDGEGDQTDYDYDNLGQLTTITPPAPLGTTTFTYDSLSRIATTTDGRGKTLCFAYDNLDRISKVADKGAGTCTSPAGSIDFTYDANGNLTQRIAGIQTTTYVYDRLNRRTDEDFPGGAFNDYAYDKASNLTSLTDGSGTASYTYDDIERISTIVAPKPGGGTDTITYSYDDTGPDRGVTQTLPGNTTNRTTWDRSRKPTEILLENSSGTDLLKRAYTYVEGADQRALIQSVTNEDGDKTTYTYKDATDDVGRLLKARTVNSSDTLIREYRYSYDKAGNRTRREVEDPPGSTTVTTYKYDDANELCWRYTGTSNNACTSPPSGATTFGYDTAGNQTSGDATMSYDNYGRMSSLNGNALSYLTSTNDELVAVGTTTFQNNALGLSRQTAGATTTSIVRDPTSGLPVSQNDGTAKRFLFQDYLGSTIGLTDASGALARTYSYTPDGQDTATGSGPSALVRFAGGHLVDGLYHFGARYYQPTTARWTQQDPLNQVGDLRQANRYTFVGGDPVNHTDPRGLWWRRASEYEWDNNTVYKSARELRAEAYELAGKGVKVLGKVTYGIQTGYNCVRDTLGDDNPAGCDPIGNYLGIEDAY